MSSIAVTLRPKRATLALFGLLALLGIGALGCTPGWYTIPADSYAPSDEVSDYDYLSGYGEWMHIPPFGMVWHPYVVVGWAPFLYGHWNWTYDGWAWISYEPFGWLVYHYGYWDYSPAVGWYWVPGSTWSPACVEWYTFGDYCGWAPMPPPGVYWPDPWQPFTVNVWVIVDINHFTDENVVRRRVVDPIPRDIIVRHPVAKQAPTVRRIEEVTKRTIEPVRIARQPSDVRPDVVKSSQQRAKRSRITTLKDMILPDTDKGKVEQYAPEVERKVLMPRKEAPVGQEKAEQPAVRQRETQKREEPQQQQQQQEKKEQQKTKKKVERR